MNHPNPLFRVFQVLSCCAMQPRSMHEAQPHATLWVQRNELVPSFRQGRCGCWNFHIFSEHQAEAMQPPLSPWQQRVACLWNSKTMHDPNTNLSGESFPPYHWWRKINMLIYGLSNHVLSVFPFRNRKKNSTDVTHLKMTRMSGQTYRTAVAAARLSFYSYGNQEAMASKLAPPK